MKRIILLAIAFIFISSSCTYLDSFKVGPGFYKKVSKQKIIQEFEKEFDLKVRYPVKMTSLQDISGLCTHVTDIFVPDKKVFIDKEQWEHAMAHEREWLMFHELGHCSLGLYHTKPEDVFKNGEPQSIMHPDKYPTYFFYYKNRDYYINELKERKGIKD